MILSVARLLDVDPGLDPRSILVMQMSLPQEDLYNGPPGHPRFCADLSDRVGGVPGVVSVSAIAHLPLSGGGAGRGLTIEGRPDPGPMQQPSAGYSVACPGILRTMGIALIAGREFTARDTVDAPGIVLVNERLATRFWPDENAIGKRFKIGHVGTNSPWLTVVGVFRNIHHFGLDSETGPSFLRPHSQAAWPSMSIVAKTASAPAAFVTPIKSALAAIEPSQPVSERPHHGRRGRELRRVETVSDDPARAASRCSRWCCRRSGSPVWSAIQSCSGRRRLASGSRSARSRATCCAW